MSCFSVIAQRVGKIGIGSSREDFATSGAHRVGAPDIFAERMDYSQIGAISTMMVISSSFVCTISRSRRVYLKDSLARFLRDSLGRFLYAKNQQDD